MVSHENREPGNREMISCEKVWHEISNYLEGDVDPVLRAAMDQHFHSCPRCASVLAGTKNVIRLYGDERMMEAPAGFGRRLEKRLAQNVRASRSRWLSLEAWLIPVAALALIVGGLHWANFWQSQRALKSQMEQAAKNIPPNMVVLVAADSKIFHVAGCPFIHGKQVRSLTAKEALREGYAPCTRCLRKYLEMARIGPAGVVPDNAKANARSDTDDDADLDDEDIHAASR
jgi:hypothetical protein